MMGEFVIKLNKLITNNSQAAMLAHLREFRGDDLEAILGELDTIIDLNYANSVNGMIQVAGAGTRLSHLRDKPPYVCELRLSTK